MCVFGIICDFIQYMEVKNRTIIILMQRKCWIELVLTDMKCFEEIQLYFPTENSVSEQVTFRNNKIIDYFGWKLLYNTFFTKLLLFQWPYQ